MPEYICQRLQPAQREKEFRAAHRIIIESSISSTPALGFEANMGGTETSKDAETTWNSSLLLDRFDERFGGSLRLVDIRVRFKFPQSAPVFPRDRALRFFLRPPTPNGKPSPYVRKSAAHKDNRHLPELSFRFLCQAPGFWARHSTRLAGKPLQVRP